MACFFGFGSLVNTGTHQYTALTPAQVQGWARAWVNTDCYEHAFLSVIPAPAARIQGLLAQVPNDDWAELDERERGYTRRMLVTDEWALETPSASAGQYPTALADLTDVQMYVHTSGEFAQAAKPILASYLETVLFGYYQVFGAEGVQAFIDTTQHWTRVLEDRANPVYPRYVPARGEAREVVLPAVNRFYHASLTELATRC